MHVMRNIKQLRTSGETITEDELVWISLLTFSHVIPNGTHFSWCLPHSNGSATTTRTNTPSTWR
jgi:hypothetical protein